MPKRTTRFFSYLLNKAGSIAFSFAAILFLGYLVNAFYWLYFWWPTESKNLSVYMFQLTSILGFGAGIYYFMSAAKRDRQKTAMSEVKNLYHEIQESRRKLRQKDIPFHEKYDKDIKIPLSDIDDWDKRLKKGELDRLLLGMLTAAEAIALGVRYRLYDEEFVFDLCGTTVLRTWQILEDYIRRKRKDINQPSFSSELELLHAKWWSLSLKAQAKELLRQAKDGFEYS